RHNEIVEGIDAGKAEVGMTRAEEGARHAKAMEELADAKVDVIAAHNADMKDIASGKLDLSRAHQDEVARHDKALEDGTTSRVKEMFRHDTSVEDIAKQRLAAGGTAQNVALRKFLEEKPEATSTDIQNFLQKGRSIRSMQAVALSKFIEEHPEAGSDAIAKFASGFAAEQKADKDFATGQQGQRINSLNVGISHAETLRELGHALKNGNVTKFNQYAQDWAAQTGQAAPTNFDTAKRIVGAEIMKALVAGGGGVIERQDMQEAFNRAGSEAAIDGAINTAERLLARQFTGLKKQYELATRREDFDEGMTSE